MRDASSLRSEDDGNHVSFNLQLTLELLGVPRQAEKYMGLRRCAEDVAEWRWTRGSGSVSLKSHRSRWLRSCNTCMDRATMYCYQQRRY